MIRGFVQICRNLAVDRVLFHPNVPRTTIIRGFQSKDLLKNAEINKQSELDELKKYRKAEVHLWHALGYQCINPELLTDEDWQHIYGLETKHQRKRYVKHLLNKFSAKKEKKAIKEEGKQEVAIRHERILAERDANPHIVYGLGHSSLLLRISRQTITRWFNMKLHKAKLYNPKLVIDCSYETHMTDMERSKVAKGLKRLYSENRKHKKPLDLHICGLKDDSAILKNLSVQIPSLLAKSSPTGVHSECFTSIFEKERLVMLTAESDKVLEYNCDDIYVIGGIVDMGRNVPLTLAKAKKLGIRTARLPLDNIRTYEGDSRELPLSSVAAIIREFQVNKNVNEILDKCLYLRSKRRNNDEKQ